MFSRAGPSHPRPGRASYPARRPAPGKHPPAARPASPPLPLSTVQPALGRARTPRESCATSPSAPRMSPAELAEPMGQWEQFFPRPLRRRPASAPAWRWDDSDRARRLPRHLLTTPPAPQSLSTTENHSGSCVYLSRPIAQTVSISRDPRRPTPASPGSPPPNFPRLIFVPTSLLLVLQSVSVCNAQNSSQTT